MIPCPRCRHALVILAMDAQSVAVDCPQCGQYSIPLAAAAAPTGKPYLGDSLPPDKDTAVDWAAEGSEPQINCWMDVDTGPDGTEKLSYMYINGAFVRDHIFVDYVEGGHFYRYAWIPENQIWMEDIMSVMDQFCTGIHETHERYRMKYLGWRYDKAHDSACEIERIVRDITLEEGTILPTADGIGRIFAIEGTGQSCETLARELMLEEGEKIPGGKKK
jgi:hypothetical protein